MQLPQIFAEITKNSSRAVTDYTFLVWIKRLMHHVLPAAAADQQHHDNICEEL